MAEDQLVHSQQLPTEPSGSQRSELSSQQIRNFKFKFPKEQWKDGGSGAEGSPTPRPDTPPEEESSDEEGSASGQSPQGETQQPILRDALLSANGAPEGNHQRRGNDSSSGRNSPRSHVALGEHQAGLNVTTEVMTGNGTLHSEGGHEESGGGGPLGESTRDGSSSTGAESSNLGDGQTDDAAPSLVEEQSSDGGQMGDPTSTSADARPACPKKQAGSRKKRRNRKKRKQNWCWRIAGWRSFR